MKLIKRRVWMFGRWEQEERGEEKFMAISAYTTEDEAMEKLKRYRDCLGKFDVVETEIWFPSEF